jgi:hypothetical protein
MSAQERTESRLEDNRAEELVLRFAEHLGNAGTVERVQRQFRRLLDMQGLCVGDLDAGGMCLYLAPAVLAVVEECERRQRRAA